jgi:hypothetical protein
MPQKRASWVEQLFHSFLYLRRHIPKLGMVNPISLRLCVRHGISTTVRHYQHSDHALPMSTPAPCTHVHRSTVHRFAHHAPPRVPILARRTLCGHLAWIRGAESE